MLLCILTDHKVIKGNCISSVNIPKFSIDKVVILPSNNIVMSNNTRNFTIWKGGNCLYTLEGHLNYISCLAVSSNGLIASGSGDDTVKIWKDDEYIYTLEGHDNPIWSLVFFPNGDLASGDTDGIIKIWRYNKCIRTLNLKYFSYVKSLVVLENGTLVSAGGDGEVNLWSCKKIPILLDKHIYTIRALVSLPNNILVLGDSTGLFKVYECNKHNKCIREMKAHDKGITCLTVLPGLIISGSEDTTIKVWKVVYDGDKIVNISLVKILLGHSEAISNLSIINNEHILSTDINSTIKIWE